MSSSQSTTGPGPLRRLLPIWALLLVFGMPPMGAWFFYLNPEYLPTGRSNQGELLSPVVALPSVIVPSATGERGAPLKRLKESWTMVALYRSPCSEGCRKRLGELRQIRKALGESAPHVERLLVLLGGVGDSEVEKLQEMFKGVIIATGSEQTFIEALQAGSHSKRATGTLEGTYILDPLDNLMMYYPDGQKADEILDDMEHLLKSSKKWMKGRKYDH